MTDQAPASDPTPVAAPPLAPAGTPVTEQIGNQTQDNNEWLEAAASQQSMQLPTVLDDGGRGAGLVRESPLMSPIGPVEEPPAPDTDVTPEEAAQNAEQEQEQPAPDSFVARANAERQRLYQQQQQRADHQDLQTAREQLQKTQDYARHNMYTAEQITASIAKDPFAFMRRHGMTVPLLNERLKSENQGQRPTQAPPSPEVAMLQQRVHKQDQAIKQMREANTRNEQTAQNQADLATLSDGLSRYRDSYPGLHAVFGENSGTTPAEQVLIGVRRAQQNGENLSADVVAERLENEARLHFSRLQTAYQPAAQPAHQQPPPAAVPRTAGISNASTAAPTNLPTRPRSRSEEIAWAASQLRFLDSPQ